jgi:hypothetical protein
LPQDIVLLNLGDRAAGGGLVAKSARSLQNKYPAQRSFLLAGNQITEVSMFQLLTKSLPGGGLTRQDAELMQVRARCQRATKIMLCLHGLHNDVDSGYANDTLNHAPMAAVATWGQLAELMLSLLPKRDKEYNLALVMCYGARSENFRLDHEGMISATDLKTSFAYKFFRRICLFRNVRMTARTGATGFDEHTGRSTVESEASVQARADKEEYLRDANTQAAINTYIALKDSYTKAAHGGSEARAQQWMLMDNKFRANPDDAPGSADETTIRDYHQVLKRKRQFETAMTDQNRTKYGKYVYQYSEKTRQLTILSKYPPPGTLLYQGPLL